MAKVSWQFGPSSFYVKVSAHDGTESEISGDKGVDEMNISFSVPPPDTNGTTSRSAVPSTSHLPSSSHGPFNPNAQPIQISVTPVVPGSVVFNVAPLDIGANFSLASDDGFVDAWWRVSREGLKGKGKGRGLGKSTELCT